MRLWAIGIAGALVGASLGAADLPDSAVAGLADWPRSVSWMRRLAQRLAEGPSRPLPLLWPVLLPRNLLFLLVVLAHGFRRLLPPYGSGYNGSVPSRREGGPA